MVTTQLGVQWGDDAFGVWRVGAGEAASYRTQDSPHNREVTGPSVSSAKAEKPCLGKMTFARWSFSKWKTCYAPSLSEPTLASWPWCGVK